MEQCIDKSAVVAEIERIISNGQTKLKESEECKDYESYVALAERIATCINILSFLDTLEVKEVDFEKELDKEWNKCEPIDEGMGLEIASIEHEQFDNIAKHFYELGLKARKGK